MDIRTATQSYESWVAAQTPLIAADIQTKHTQMAAGVFPFLRATFYRWMQRWPEVCPGLVAFPQVLDVKVTQQGYVLYHADLGDHAGAAVAVTIVNPVQNATS